MKRFKITGRVMTKDSYPYSMTISIVIWSITEENAKEQVWKMFNNPIEAFLDAKEGL